VSLANILESRREAGGREQRLKLLVRDGESVRDLTLAIAKKCVPNIGPIAYGYGIGYILEVVNPWSRSRNL
jgi:hypothetical protein